MKHIYIFLSLFLLGGVLSSYSNASFPSYYRDCHAMIHDHVLWNHGKPPNTKHWTPHCWSLVYYELGRWHFDKKMYGKKLLEERQRAERRALRWSPENNKKRLWAEQKRVHQIKYAKYGGKWINAEEIPIVDDRDDPFAFIIQSAEIQEQDL